MADRVRRPKRLVESGAIPRTHGAAKRRGFKKSKIKFADLSDQHKDLFVQFDGGTAGSVCGVAPSPDPNYWLVCYKDENGKCNWVEVPKGASVRAHG